MSHLLLYVPICLIILVVLEVCKSDDPKLIARKALANFGVLTGVLVGGGLVIFLIQKFL